VAFKKYAERGGLVAENINGDAFSNEIKRQTIGAIRDKLGSVDCVVYSLASPKRVDPATGVTYRSVLKPIGNKFTSKTVDVSTGEVRHVEIEPASPDEITDTIKVMGGEDWELWIRALLDENVLANGAKTVAYSYLGPEITKPIYADGTIGRAKEDLDRASGVIDSMLARIGGHAYVSVNKAVVTQASAAIPVVPLYISILFAIMKKKNLHEGCIEQAYRLFKSHLYAANGPRDRGSGKIRIDNFEMRRDVQAAVIELWEKVSTENLSTITDIDGYRSEFFKLFGFGVSGVNYDLDVEV
jgi:enoyl-[acyl-carrier protein] reductase/trans-2-enoyl-CoA reductase (NAD+)